MMRLVAVASLLSLSTALDYVAFEVRGPRSRCPGPNGISSGCILHGQVRTMQTFDTPAAEDAPRWPFYDFVSAHLLLSTGLPNTNASFCISNKSISISASMNGCCSGSHISARQDPPVSTSHLKTHNNFITMEESIFISAGMNGCCKDFPRRPINHGGLPNVSFSIGTEESISLSTSMDSYFSRPISDDISAAQDDPLLIDGLSNTDRNFMMYESVSISATMRDGCRNDAPRRPIYDNSMPAEQTPAVPSLFNTNGSIIMEEEFFSISASIMDGCSKDATDQPSYDDTAVEQGPLLSGGLPSTDNSFIMEESLSFCANMMGSFQNAPHRRIFDGISARQDPPLSTICLKDGALVPAIYLAESGITDYSKPVSDGGHINHGIDDHMLLQPPSLSNDALVTPAGYLAAGMNGCCKDFPRPGTYDDIYIVQSDSLPVSAGLSNTNNSFMTEKSILGARSMGGCHKDSPRRPINHDIICAAGLPNVNFSIGMEESISLSTSMDSYFKNAPTHQPIYDFISAEHHLPLSIGIPNTNASFCTMDGSISISTSMRLLSSRLSGDALVTPASCLSKDCNHLALDVDSEVLQGRSKTTLFDTTEGPTIHADTASVEIETQKGGQNGQALDGDPRVERDGPGILESIVIDLGLAFGSGFHALLFPILMSRQWPGSHSARYSVLALCVVSISVEPVQAVVHYRLPSAGPVAKGAEDKDSSRNSHARQLHALQRHRRQPGAHWPVLHVPGDRAKPETGQNRLELPHLASPAERHAVHGILLPHARQEYGHADRRVLGWGKLEVDKLETDRAATQRAERQVDVR
jgi:hypothetical protein